MIDERNEKTKWNIYQEKTLNRKPNKLLLQTLKYFDRFWTTIVASININGRFSGNFFGDRDELKNENITEKQLLVI